MSLRSGYAASGITDFNKIKWALQILCSLAIAATVNHLKAQWLKTVLLLCPELWGWGLNNLSLAWLISEGLTLIDLFSGLTSCKYLWGQLFPCWRKRRWCYHGRFLNSPLVHPWFLPSPFSTIHLLRHEVCVRVWGLGSLPCFNCVICTFWLQLLVCTRNSSIFQLTEQLQVHFYSNLL